MLESCKSTSGRQSRPIATNWRDKFRNTQHPGKAVDRVRRREEQPLRAAGEDRLKGTRRDWLRHPAAMEADDRKIHHPEEQ